MRLKLLKIKLKKNFIEHKNEKIDKKIKYIESERQFNN